MRTRPASGPIETASPKDPTVGLCLGPCGGPTGEAALSYEKGTLAPQVCVLSLTVTLVFYLYLYPRRVRERKNETRCTQARPIHSKSQIHDLV